MATSAGHVAAGAALLSVFFPGRLGVRIIFLTLLLSVLPDFDVLMFKLGIPYSNPLGHRGFFHSILFLLICASAASIYISAKRKYSMARFALVFMCMSAVALSHSALDAMTNGGLGVGFFIPFDNARYFLPWRPVEVSPITAEKILSKRGASVFQNELHLLIFPSLCVAAVFSLLRIVFAKMRRARVRQFSCER